MVQTPGGEEAVGALGMLIVLAILGVGFAIAIFQLIAMWKVYAKAGHPGWAALIPIYQTYVHIKVAGYPGWWLILAFIPIVNLILIVLPFGHARNFGYGAGFGLGLLLLPIIFYPIIAFGDARYVGPPA
jgi:hypothetical protein